jgi:hypothetical protein
MDRNIKNPPTSPGGQLEPLPFCADATGIDEVGWEKFGGGQIFLGIDEGDHGVGFDS